MAEKEPPGRQFIQVQPSKSNEERSPISTGNSVDAIQQKIKANTNNSKFFPVKSPMKKDRTAQIEKSFYEVEITFSNHIEELFSAKTSTQLKQDRQLEPLDVQKAKEEVKGERRKKRKKSRKKNNRVLPLDDTNGQAGDSPRIEADVDAVCPKKSKETKTKVSKKGKENKKQVKAEMTVETSEPEGKTEDNAGNTNRKRKLPCLFGFISTWLAKRKERRREKKRKAIASRACTQRLVEYDHKTARGGEAFTIEVDNRPISLSKPLLPPIKQNSGPIRLERHENAMSRRAESLTQKMDAARIYDKKKTRCKARKAEDDYQFRYKADINIKQKQANAERNRDIRSRCQSKINKIRTPSAEPASEPSAEPSLGSIHGPSFESDEDYDRDALSWVYSMIKLLTSKGSKGVEAS